MNGAQSKTAQLETAPSKAPVSDNLKADPNIPVGHNQSQSVGASKEESAEGSQSFSELKSRLDDLAVEFGNFEALIDYKVTSNSQKLKSDVVEEFREVLTKIEAKHTQVEEAINDLDDIGDERKDFISRYRPGTIEFQHQQIEELTKDRENKRKQLREKNDLIDQLERERDSYKLQSGQKDLEEIEKLKQVELANLDAIQKEHGQYQTLLAENRQLRNENLDLKEIKERVDQQTNLEDDLIQRREQILQLQNQVSELESEKQNWIQKSDRMRKKLKRTEQERDTSQQKHTHIESHVSELDSEVESLKAQLETHEKNYDKYIEAQARISELEKKLIEERAQLDQKRLEQSEENHSFRQSLESQLRTTIEQTHRGELEGLESLVRRLSETESSLQGQVDEWRNRYHADSAEFRDLQEIRRHASSLQNRIANLQENERELEDAKKSIANSIAELQGTQKTLVGEVASYEKRLERIRDEVKNKERAPSREERISVMLEVPRNILKGEVLKVESETKWLGRVANNIKESGFFFPTRLLKAFHTSLKIADWSSLTVLAGVSGTGKSELPRLYSRFGGMNFIGVPVQPNWDTPADLFGFYDYLSEQFKPTELLRCMIQSDEEGIGSDSMLVVMLDEMNLARVELYFSELLSRLETRRDKGEVPTMPIDIGPGVTSYELKLRNNLLFVGTINEDETTNTLSDKVIDRSNVIYFPRPKSLATRDDDSLASSEKNRLSFSTWRNWRRSVTDISPTIRSEIKSAFEEINTGLALVNRAVAHRVLQITEQYIANHPDFPSQQENQANEWQTPFEDQVAQKLMPKLRGISAKSTNGRECIRIIEGVIEQKATGLCDDFQKARETEHGQFQWNSSSYLYHGESKL